MAMGDVFHELKEHQENIIKILDEEEATFCKTMVTSRDNNHAFPFSNKTNVFFFFFDQTKQLIMDLSNEKATDQIRAKAVNKLFKVFECKSSVFLFFFFALLFFSLRRNVEKYCLFIMFVVVVVVVAGKV